MAEYIKIAVALACSFVISLVFYYSYLYITAGIALFDYSLGFSEIFSIIVFIIVSFYIYKKYSSFGWALGLTLLILGIDIILFTIITAVIGFVLFGPLMTASGFNILAAIVVIVFLIVGTFFVLFGLKLRRFSEWRSEEEWI